MILVIVSTCPKCITALVRQYMVTVLSVSVYLLTVKKYFSKAVHVDFFSYIELPFVGNHRSSVELAKCCHSL